MRAGTRSAARVLGLLGLVSVAFLLEWRFHFSAAFDPDRIEQGMRDAGPLGPVLFVFVMAATVVSPIPTLPLDVVAGQLFGPVLGTLYAVVGATLGAMASFLLARFLGRDFIARFLKGHINFCQQCSDRLLTKIVFLARLIPAVSFDMVSYGAGLTKMSLLRFAAASFAGMLPLTTLYVAFGPKFFVGGPIAWIGGAFVVSLFFLLPRWIERYDLFGVARFLRHPGSGETTSWPGQTDEIGAGQ